MKLKGQQSSLGSKKPGKLLRAVIRHLMQPEMATAERLKNESRLFYPSGKCC
jgi:hypothetical protein